jgi:hypothetical protein
MELTIRQPVGAFIATIDQYVGTPIAQHVPGGPFLPRFIFSNLSIGSGLHTTLRFFLQRCWQQNACSSQRPSFPVR